MASSSDTLSAPPRASGAVTSALELAVLGAIWGASFLFMRVAAPSLGAFALVEVRVVCGALVLLPFLWRDRASFAPREWPRIAVLALLNSAVPFCLFAWAASRAPAGVGAITNSTAALFTWLVAAIFWGERIGRVRALALVTGFVGVIVLASGRTAGASFGLAAAAGTVAAFLYGVGNNLAKHQMQGRPPVALAAATLVASAVMLLPLAVAEWPAHEVPLRAWLASATLGVLCTGIAYAFYFRLIQRIGGPRAATVAYLIPLFGVTWAWLLLDEPLTVPMAIAGALILGSVALAQRAR